MRNVGLHAVIEPPDFGSGYVGPLPPRPWPEFVRLWRGAHDADVMLVIAQCALWSHISDAEPPSPRDLVDLLCPMLPGGVAIISATDRIDPGTSSKLEFWREWKTLLKTGRGSGRTHGADVRFRDGAFHFTAAFTSSEILAAYPREQYPKNGPIVMSYDELADALAALERDLVEFLGRFRSVLATMLPDHAERITNRFDAAFVSQDGPSQPGESR